MSSSAPRAAVGPAGPRCRRRGVRRVTIPLTTVAIPGLGEGVVTRETQQHAERSGRKLRVELNTVVVCLLGAVQLLAPQAGGVRGLDQRERYRPADVVGKVPAVWRRSTAACGTGTPHRRACRTAAASTTYPGIRSPARRRASVPSGQFGSGGLIVTAGRTVETHCGRPQIGVTDEGADIGCERQGLERGDVFGAVRPRLVGLDGADHMLAGGLPRRVWPPLIPMFRMDDGAPAPSNQRPLRMIVS